MQLFLEQNGISICVVRACNMGFVVRYKALKLSQFNAGGCFKKIVTSFNKETIQVSSEVVTAIDRYSPSALELAAIGYFLACQEMQF